MAEGRDQASLEEESQIFAQEYWKLYSNIVDFKNNIAQIFINKGLLNDGKRLHALKPVTTDLHSEETVLEMDQLCSSVLLVFQLIAELFQSHVGNELKQLPKSEDRQTQTDQPESFIIQSSCLPLTLLKQEINDLSLEQEILACLPEADKTTSGHIKNKVSSSPAPSGTAVRKSSRSSVLNRKSFANLIKRPRGRPRKSQLLTEKIEKSKEPPVNKRSDTVAAELDDWPENKVQLQQADLPAAESKTENAESHFKVVQCKGELEDHLSPSTALPRSLPGRRSKVYMVNLYERLTDGRFRCKECGKVSKLQTNIRKHLRKHTGEKPYACPSCPATFAYPRSLRRHQLVHEGIRPFSCTSCPKQFFDVTSLRAHALTHTDIRAYSCCQCADRFRTKEGLKGHMRRHTGDRPYVCERCGQAFSAKRSLTRHIRVHTGERPYSCDKCVACFADWTTLHNHQLVHTETTANIQQGQGQGPGSGSGVKDGKPYQCQFCGARYRQPLSLKRHLEVHNTDPSKVQEKKRKKVKKREEGKETDGEESTALHRQYRPYRCELCDMRFKHLRGFQSHKLKHEKGRIEKDGTKTQSHARRLKQLTELKPAGLHLASEHVPSLALNGAALKLRNSFQNAETATTITTIGVPGVQSPLTNTAMVTMIDPAGTLPAINSDLTMNAASVQGIILAPANPATAVSAISGLPGEMIQPVSQVGEVVQYNPAGNMTRIYQYAEGTYQEVTALLPHPAQPLHLPRVVGPAMCTPGIHQGQMELHDTSVLTIIFEAGSGGLAVSGTI